MKSKAYSEDPDQTPLIWVCSALASAVDIDELPGIRRCILLWLSDRTAQLIDDAISIKNTCISYHI